MKRRVFIHGPAELIKKPFIYQLVKDYDIVPYIRRANVLDKESWMILELEAQDAEGMDRGINFLRQTGANVEPVEGDVVES
ncbi:MAG: NIL domain-containing protein [bacterium]